MKAAETAYTEYLNEHRELVREGFNYLCNKGIISDTEAGAVNTIIDAHDMSKFLEEEFRPYALHFCGKDKSKKAVEDFNMAWLHHIQHNPHHWQHWVLINNESDIQALEMPKEYVIEMIADWWSFSHKAGDLYEIFKWYNSNKKTMILHSNTKKLVEELLEQIKEVLDKEKSDE